MGGSARAWDETAHGEAATAAVLAGLPAGWTALHDLKWQGRTYDNVDHVVVGPPGIFVIDSRVWSGSVSVSRGVLRQDGHDRTSAIQAAIAAASAVSSSASAARFDHVHGVLCLVGKDVPAEWVGGVLVCSAAELVEELTSYAEVLPGGVAVVVAAEVQRQLNAASGPSTVTVRMPSFGERTKEARGAAAQAPRTPIKVGSLARFGLGIAMVIAVGTNPQVVTSVSGGIKDFVVEAVNPPDNDNKLPEPVRDRKKPKQQRETQR
jgi:hypothetical protein